MFVKIYIINTHAPPPPIFFYHDWIGYSCRVSYFEQDLSFQKLVYIIADDLISFGSKHLLFLPNWVDSGINVELVSDYVWRDSSHVMGVTK